MKKLMIAAAIVCAAAMVQAAQVVWQENTIQIDGDWSEGIGTMAPEGWQMYLFDSNGAGTTYAQMQSLLAAATTEAGYANWKTAMGDNAAIGTVGADQTISVDGVTMIDVADTFKGYGVILDAESLDKATFAFLVAEQSWDKGASTTFVSLGEDFDIPGGNFINALDYSADPKTGWTAVGAVPEPTSGLLLLIGVAGLALRRRRA